MAGHSVESGICAAAGLWIPIGSPHLNVLPKGTGIFLSRNEVMKGFKPWGKSRKLLV